MYFSFIYLYNLFFFPTKSPYFLNCPESMLESMIQSIKPYFTTIRTGSVSIFYCCTNRFGLTFFSENEHIQYISFIALYLYFHSILIYFWIMFYLNTHPGPLFAKLSRNCDGERYYFSGGHLLNKFIHSSHNPVTFVSQTVNITGRRRNCKCYSEIDFAIIIFWE